MGYLMVTEKKRQQQQKYFTKNLFLMLYLHYKHHKNLVHSFNIFTFFSICLILAQQVHQCFYSNLKHRNIHCLQNDRMVKSDTITLSMFNVIYTKLANVFILL